MGDVSVYITRAHEQALRCKSISQGTCVRNRKGWGGGAHTSSHTIIILHANCTFLVVLALRRV